MIHIDRSEPSPEPLLGKAATAELEHAASFFGTTSKQARQTRFRFERRLWEEGVVREALRRVFRDKCAYCERLLAPHQLQVDHFRPPFDAIDVDGRYDAAHYFWLAFDWRNLYPACPECVRSKRNVFPIAAARAPIGAAYESLGAEEPLLLDPCVDDPEEYLLYDAGGRMISENRRGRMTIELLGLNRSELVRSRALARREFLPLLGSLERDGDQRALAELRRRVSPEAQFCGLHRQLLAQSGASPETLASQTSEAVQSAVHKAQSKLSAMDAEEVASSFEAYKQGLDSYTLAENVRPGMRREAFILLDQTVERIEISNVRIFERLAVDVASRAETAPWLMILGENGTGKSTLLQAFALALIGDDARTRLGLDLSGYVRRGEPEAAITLHLAGLTDALRLVVRADGVTSGTAIEPKVPVLAYGSARFLPSAGARPGQSTPYARVGNLFDHFAALADANEWLLGLGEEEFDGAARTLKEILTLPDEAVLEANHATGRVEIPWLGARSLAELSDGYQSIVAMTVDIMKVMAAHFTAMESAKGIVLIDEIGAHLHPRWRMRIVERLRSAFPHVQFIATTHDPLCLRGLRDGEVIVLRRSADGDVLAVTDLPSVTGLRVDQLLTSEHFGLSSTIDPDIERDMARYQRLLVKADLTAAEQDELTRLEKSLADRQVLGTTERERIMLEAIDRYFGTVAQASSPVEKSKLRSELDAKLLSIMSGGNRER